ncbi:MAG: hypothetical protein IJQ07_05210 [Clostridia bacterium]|nr:hypothetical protein [Clostridia bacterium]
MKQIKIQGKIEFCKEENKQYNRKFKARLTESPAFAYGNRTAVVIEFGKMANGRTPDNKLLDTRYDTTIKKNEKDFKLWITKWFKDNYQEHILTID